MQITSFESPKNFEAFVEHFEDCKEVCDTFGSQVFTLGHHPVEYTKSRKKGQPCPEAPLLELKHVKKTESTDSGMFWESPGAGLSFDDWDDLDDDSGDVFGQTNNEENKASDEELISLAKNWVQAIVADLGICPFATSAEKAGLPLGPVSYPVCRASTAEEIFLAFWEEVTKLQSNSDKDQSTTLLILPNFCQNNADAFDNFAGILTKTLEPLGLGEGSQGIQLVFFHPE